jgi:hypothetical protein
MSIADAQTPVAPSDADKTVRTKKPGAMAGLFPL